MGPPRSSVGRRTIRPYPGGALLRLRQERESGSQRAAEGRDPGRGLGKVV